MDLAVKTSPRGEPGRERTRPVVPRTRPGLVRGIAIGNVPLVIASCAAVFGAGPGSAGQALAGAGGLDSSLMHEAEIPLRGMDPVRWATRLMGGILLTNRGVAGLLGILFAF
jgi:hypothetical protein